MNIDKDNKQKSPLEKTSSNKGMKKGKDLLEMMDQTSTNKKPINKSNSAKRGAGSGN